MSSSLDQKIVRYLQCLKGAGKGVSGQMMSDALRCIGRIDNEAAAYALERGLREVADGGISKVSVGAIIGVALAIWHSTCIPKLDELSGASRGDAVALVTRLALYNCLSVERKMVMRNVTAMQANCALPDAAAEDFEIAYCRFLPALQPLQTRHAERLFR